MSASSSPSAPSDAHRGAGPGRPKDLGKRAAILEAAKRLFTTHGFDGVSMDQIATEAGVSKLTVYSHFGDKESLFGAAVRAKCEEQLPSELFLVGLEGSLREQMVAIARAFFALVTSEEAVAMHRMMMIPGAGDSHVRELFWQAGPQRVKEGFATFLRDEVARGALDIPDIDRAASQFFCLLKGEVHMQLMCGLCCMPPSDDVDTHIEATVDLFLRAYSPGRGAMAPEPGGDSP
ncbi:MAG: TetR/AcrR family transcriptional regulator [Xanthomonadaceae bacterium]|nr:TetR/AcrR family transcriptional regulator [Xanthomonadaceae bacterium]